MMKRVKAHLIGLHLPGLFFSGLFFVVGWFSIFPSLIAQDFKILFISDTHISNDAGKMERLQGLVNRLNSGAFPGVDVLIHGGDVVASVYDEHPHKSPHATNRLARAMAIFTQLKIPFYLAMGNHDYKIWHDRDSDAYFTEEEILQMESIWKKQTGFDPYYAVVHKGWNIILLNSMRGRYLHRHFDEQQMNFLEQELQKGLPTLIVSHFPLKTDHFRIWCWPKDLITPQQEPRFFALLKKFRNQVKGIFVGHGHMWRQDVLFGKILVYEVADFAEREEVPYYLIECSSPQEKIRVVKGNLSLKIFQDEAIIK